MFGRPEYAQVNERVNQVFAERETVIVSHRGCGVGTAAPETPLAVAGALKSGADAVNLDVCASSDLTYYCFHDGYEAELLGIDANLQTLTTAQIDKASYIWADQPAHPQRVAKLLPLLREFAGQTLFFLDRSWWRWPHLLQALGFLKMPDQIVLKCPARENAALEQLRRFDAPYPLVPICADLAEANAVLDDPKLNVVGLELLATTPDGPWFDRDTIDHLHARGAFCLVNTLSLTTGVPLFGGLDDNSALTTTPEAAYGPIVDLGIDAIHTDWPWLVRDFLDARHTPARSMPSHLEAVS